MEVGSGLFTAPEFSRFSLRLLTIKPSVAAVGRQSGAYLGAGRLESHLSGRSRTTRSSSSLKYPPPPCVSPGGYRAAGLGARAAGLGSQGAYGASGVRVTEMLASAPLLSDHSVS